MTITSLVDDYCPKRGFRGEHGVSLFIGTLTSKILLDMGQTNAFIANAELMGIDLSSLDAAMKALAIAALEPKAVFCAHCAGPRGFSALFIACPARLHGSNAI